MLRLAGAIVVDGHVNGVIPARFVDGRNMRLAHATPAAAIRRQRAVHGAGTIGRLEALVSHDDESDESERMN